jgi:deoxyinosine 3'endonuclease (endonuclease V)
MQQLEIQYFWPLTEQLPLDLNYAPCEPPKLTVAYDVAYDTGVTFATYPTGAWATVGTITLKTTELTIETPYMPWYRKLAYKLMGFKWK